jgi:hypothetical protein
MESFKLNGIQKHTATLASTDLIIFYYVNSDSKAPPYTLMSIKCLIKSEPLRWIFFNVRPEGSFRVVIVSLSEEKSNYFLFIVAIKQLKNNQPNWLRHT